MKLNTDENGELAYAFSPYISVEKLNTNRMVYVDNGKISNGLTIRELEGCSGNYKIRKDIGTGFNIVDNKNFYKLRLLKQKFPPLSFFKNEYSLNHFNWDNYVPYIVNNKELSIITCDLFRQIKNYEEVWIEDKTLTKHINCDCKFSRFLKNQFRNEINSVRNMFFEKNNYFGFSKKLNSCIGVTAELYGKYLSYGPEWIGKNYIVTSIKEFEKKATGHIKLKYSSINGSGHYPNMWIPEIISIDDMIDCSRPPLKQKIIIRACILFYRKLINDTYGQGASKKISLPNVSDLITDKDGFCETVIRLGEKISTFISEKLNIKKAKTIRHSFITDRLVGVADAMDENIIIEIKCTNKLNEKMMLQGLSYYYLSQFRPDININKIIIFDAVSEKNIEISLPFLEKNKKMMSEYEKFQNKIRNINKKLLKKCNNDKSSK